jgi:hypothetical protein
MLTRAIILATIIECNGWLLRQEIEILIMVELIRRGGMLSLVAKVVNKRGDLV